MIVLWDWTPDVAIWTDLFNEVGSSSETRASWSSDCILCVEMFEFYSRQITSKSTANLEEIFVTLFYK